MNLESQLLEWLRKHVPGSARLAVGLGDDAAVLTSSADAGTVVTTDLLTDGVDFLLEEIDPRRVGRKSLGANLSDLAAMAARPVAAFVSLALPRDGTSRLTALELAIAIYEGMLPLAEEFDVAIAGGDTNSWDGPLAISITAIGETSARGPLTRSGAKPGDQLFVTGQLGGSILGRHLDMEPRIREALLLHERYELHAAIDISDGLAIDASRLAEASQCGVVLELQAIPIAPAADELSRKDRRSALDHALGDGEDFELLVAVPPVTASQWQEEHFQPPTAVPIKRIGTFVPERGLWHLDDDCQRQPLEPRGYQHRAER